MAKQLSAQKASEMIIEEREVSEDDKGDEISEYEDHISVDSE